METIKASETLADLAVRLPAASKVFRRYGLDFCCHGSRALSEVCAQRGLDPAVILQEITSATAEAGEGTRWDERSLAELIEHIEGHYHRRLRTELPELVALATRVESRHQDKPSCPRGLQAHLTAIHEAVLDHLAKEEQILFPMIRSGRARLAVGPINVMESEHLDHAANLQRTRALTNDLTAPEEACATWRALYLRLIEFEAELMEHIHLENNILFRRVLAA
jgi:regulator of cell morphogenesis and NO signaling